MFSHYLSTALRHFRRHKLVTAINVACLAIGFVSFTLAWGVAAYFAHADGYHERAGRTFIVTPTSDGISMQTSSPWLLAENLAAKIEAEKRHTNTEPIKRRRITTTSYFPVVRLSQHQPGAAEAVGRAAARLTMSVCDQWRPARE